ncbi:MAG: DNA-binding transcriptional repressor PuuR [Syntrophus sp. PtaB.Bin075]|nr:MAG: DNA-binding transcriptional repressor PuuR [Syntrophus sp. PtaB.Bin075]
MIENNDQGNILGKAFGIILSQLRRNVGLSQEHLGFESGYHRTYISLLERGKKSPSLQTIFDLSKALNIDPAEFIKQVELEYKARLKNREEGT